MADEKDTNKEEQKTEAELQSASASSDAMTLDDKEATADKEKPAAEKVKDKPEEAKEEPKEEEVEDEKEAVNKINPDEIKPGMTIRVHQKIRDVNAKGEEKERIQVFEGIILAKRGKTLENCRILVRKIAASHVGVEKLFPLASPTIVKIEPVKIAKVRRAKLYFLRAYKKRLREKKLT